MREGRQTTKLALWLSVVKSVILDPRACCKSLLLDYFRNVTFEVEKNDICRSRCGLCPCDTATLHRRPSLLLIEVKETYYHKATDQIEDQASVKNIPQLLRGLNVDLPVILETLQRSKDHAANSKFADETRAKLKKVVDNFHTQIRALYQIMESIKSSTRDPVRERAYKAFQGVWHEAEIQRLRAQLAEHRSVLMDHVTSCSISSQQADFGEENMFCPACEHDPGCVDRSEVMQ